MSINTSASPKNMPSRRVLIIGIVILLGIALTFVFVWMQTGHVIALPGLVFMDDLWKLFICRCISIDGPIQLT